MYLLDTNTGIYYLQGALPQKAMQRLSNIIDERPLISVITKIELLGFNFSSIEEQNITETFVNGAFINRLDDAIANQTIALRKQYRIKIPDAIIAATAIVHRHVLFTRNIHDFDKITSLNCIDPILL